MGVNFYYLYCINYMVCSRFNCYEFYQHILVYRILIGVGCVLESNWKQDYWRSPNQRQRIDEFQFANWRINESRIGESNVLADCEFVREFVRVRDTTVHDTYIYILSRFTKDYTLNFLPKKLVSPNDKPENRQEERDIKFKNLNWTQQDH